jgi:hydroxyethylthiazole kinase-like uncharacterized protein yjeF
VQPVEHTSLALYSAHDVKLIERKACALSGIALYELMQRAGLAAWQLIQIHYPQAERITVLAGSGNNAGDGFIVAWHAHQAGKQVQILTARENPQYKGDAAIAFDQLADTDIAISPFTEDKLSTTDLLVDGLLGTGLSGPLRDSYLAVINTVNRWHDHTGNAVFSLDIPSGLNAETGTVSPTAIQSDRCLSFIDLKPGMVTGMAREYCPVWSVDALDVTPEAREDFTPSAHVDDANALIHHLPRRAATSHKGNHGRLLLIGGDDGYGGAILMAAQAAARIGVGRFTIVTRDNHIAPFLTQLPEAMIRSVDTPNSAEFQQLLQQSDAIVIGPGLGQREWGRELLSATLSVNCPMIIDADGLNLLAEHKQQKPNWVLTPHPGEAGRLLAKSVADVENNRYQTISELQANYAGTIILKGAGTLIANSDHTTVCIDGNPGMATAGMGDVLSGIVGSLMAQGLEPNLAARTAVALHAKAADIAAQQGEKGLLATDLLGPLRQLVNEV